MRFQKHKGLYLWILLALSLCGDSHRSMNTAEPTTILFVGAIALAVVAGMLLSRKVDAVRRDQRLPTTAQRGDQLAYIQGRRIVPGEPMHCFRRFSREEHIEGGGKGGAFGGGPKQIVYYEDAVHALVLGPGNGMFQIIKNQTQVIFQGPITPDTVPSGSLLADNEGNAFKIYWGERLQPVNNDLAGEDAMGIASRWPYWFYIHWIQRKLGTNAVWPQLDYDISCTCVGTTLGGSECNFEESTPGAGDSGVNGAHVVYQLMTGAYPHGAGYDTTKLNGGTLRDLGVIIEQERTPQNILIASGTSLPDILDDIFADLGVMLVQNGDELVFMPIRPVSNPPVLSDPLVVIPSPTFDVLQGNEQDDLLIFMYPGIQNQYLPTDLPEPDDATSRYYGRRKPRQIQMATICDAKTATIVAQRRKLLFLADGNQMQVEVTKTARRLIPGMVAVLPTIGQIRVTAIQPISTSAKARLTASLDQYGLAAGGWNPDPGGGSGGPSLPTPDDAFYAFELPHSMVGPNLRIGVVRVRRDGRGIPAVIWVSTNGTTYQALANQMGSAAGFTVPALPRTTKTITDGPVMTGTTAAAAKVQDLSGDEGGWLTGAQLFILDNECMFLRSITATGGGYRPNGIIRNRLNTRRDDHSAGTLGAVISPEAITAIGSSSWGVGMTLYVKAQPQGIDIDSIVPVTLTLTGKALGGPPVDNFGPLKNITGDYIEFRWTSRLNEGTGGGAGEIPFGEPCVTEPQPFEGNFKVEILTALGVVVRTVDTNTNHQYQYTWADRVSDGIGSNAFKVRVTHMIDSYGGYPCTYDIGAA